MFVAAVMFACACLVGAVTGSLLIAGGCFFVTRNKALV